MLHSKRWSFGNYADKVKSGNVKEMAELVKSQLDSSFDLKTLEWVRSLWPGKLIVKGILDVEDAKMAIGAGADAILVSNHGGRQLDSAPSTASVLTSIVDAVGDNAKFMSTAAVRSGLDVLKFLGLGARACFIGRAYLYGLGAYGQAGVTKALEILKDELSIAMALTGITDVAKVPRDIILRARRPPPSRLTRPAGDRSATCAFIKTVRSEDMAKTGGDILVETLIELGRGHDLRDSRGRDQWRVRGASRAAGQGQVRPGPARGSGRIRGLRLCEVHRQARGLPRDLGTRRHSPSERHL